jgi:ABC-2 type transport system permease protein
MAGPLLHDLGRTFRSKSVVVSMVVIVLLSLGLVPLVKLASAPSLATGGGTAVVYYHRSSQYHFIAFSYNPYGQPLQGTSLNVTVTDPSGTRSSTATSNSSGLASWAMPEPDPLSQTSISLRVNGNFESQYEGPTNDMDGIVMSLGGAPLPLVTDPANSSQVDALFFFAGPNGTLPTGYSLYYNYANSSGGNIGDRSAMKFLGNATGYVTVFKLPPIPLSDSTVEIAAYDPTGAMSFGSSSTTSNGGFVPPQPKVLFASFISSILSLVVPLMTILVAYNSYGKDRATGVLESVLVRPVTRRGLAVTRFLSIILAISTAILVMMEVMEVEAQLLIGALIPVDFAAYTVLGLVVEVSAFTGLTLLISHLMKSTGGIMGAGIVLWVVLDFFWGVFVLLAAFVLGVQIGSGNYLGMTIDSSLFNPAQFYSLVGQLSGGGLSGILGSASSASPATYGLTPLTLVLDGAFWALAPLAGFLYLATHRD